MEIVKHPEYTEMLEQYERWRLIEEGGDEFIDEFLLQRGNEDLEDFNLRKSMSWNPGDASSAVRDIQYAAYQRIASEVKRIGGSETYQTIITGKEGGVDLKNSTMTSFINRKVLGELLFMGKVGVYIDAPIIDSPIINNDKHPYLVIFTAEQIVNWSETNGTITTLLLKEFIEKKTVEGLVEELIERYRYIQLKDKKVIVTFHDESGNQIDKDTNELSEQEYLLNLNQIPFVIFELSQSLLQNIDRAQITLLNLESGDINWLHRSNINILTIQEDSYTRLGRLHNDNEEDIDAEDSDNPDEIKIGETQGLTFTDERPGYISPSAEPINASIAKEDKIREGIERLLNVILRDLTSSSAESKSESKKGMEAGLAAIGAELEYGDNLIAKFIDLYLNKTEFATVKYPEKYELLTDEQKNAKADKLSELQHNLPSKTAQQQILIEQVELTLGSRLDKKTLDIIKDEILKSPGLTSDPVIIADLVEKGIMSKQLSGELLNLPDYNFQQAQKEHIERINAIAISQTIGAARGVDDISIDPLEAKDEKTISQNPDTK